ncbi:hypothetical protein BDF21DRAFT_412222 [Thamnidium elegans]|nr:hypothetical protein BDF21DRAFT_412222 [Thamnidium elegans]
MIQPNSAVEIISFSITVVKPSEATVTIDIILKRMVTICLFNASIIRFGERSNIPNYNTLNNYFSIK